MDSNSLIDLYRHMEWADAAVWSSVLASESGQTDTKLRGYLLHLHMVQRTFLSVWRGEPTKNPYPTFEDAQVLMAWGREYYDEIFAYLKTLNDAVLSEPIVLPWASMVEKRLGRPPATSTMGDTLLQVPMHSIYHRGQVNARLKEVGGVPPNVDYILWVWVGRPGGVWPSGRRNSDG
jgi:uncharacterized damage-inducible protein DinB